METEIHYEKFYATSSIKIVAWLLVKKNIKHQEVLRTGRSVQFFYEHSQELYDSINEYQMNYELKQYLVALDDTRKLLRAI